MIKDADKGSAVVVWVREDYIKEAKNQPGYTNIYEEVPNSIKPLTVLWTSYLTLQKTFIREGCLYWYFRLFLNEGCQVWQLFQKFIKD